MLANHTLFGLFERIKRKKAYEVWNLPKLLDYFYELLLPKTL